MTPGQYRVIIMLLALFILEALLHPNARSVVANIFTTVPVIGNSVIVTKYASTGVKISGTSS